MVPGPGLPTRSRDQPPGCDSSSALRKPWRRPADFSDCQLPAACSVGAAATECCMLSDQTQSSRPAQSCTFDTPNRDASTPTGPRSATSRSSTGRLGVRTAGHDLRRVAASRRVQAPALCGLTSPRHSDGLCTQASPYWQHAATKLPPLTPPRSQSGAAYAPISGVQSPAPGFG